MICLYMTDKREHINVHLAVNRQLLHMNVHLAVKELITCGKSGLLCDCFSTLLILSNLI